MRRVLASLILFAVLLPVSAAADESDAIPRHPAWADSDSGVAFGRFFYFEPHGYLRFRGDLFWNGDIVDGAGYSGILPPVLENSANQGYESGHKGNDLIGSANMRFRFSPTMRIGERFQVHTIVDVLDNLVLGSTPSGGWGPNTGLWTSTQDGQAPPTEDVNSLYDAIRVKALWVDMLVFDAITIRIGRIPDDWGLGLLRNGGLDIDDDYGSSVDRVEFMGSYAGFHFGLTWDMFFDALTSETEAQPYGQPYELGEADDIYQWILFVEQRPRRPEEIEERERMLHEQRKPVFDWGFMSAFRKQTTSAERQEASPGEEEFCEEHPYDCYRLADRDAFLWTPDLWGRLLWAPKAGHLLRIELELAMIYGNISSTEFLRTTDTAKDVIQGGGALEVEYAIDRTSFGLDFGFATGDDTDGLFGIQDGSEVIDTSEPSAASFQVNNRKLTNFKMHRAFRVDQLLYREVIGAVTNSFYLSPWVQHVFLDKGVHKLGARLDLLYARAFDRDGTPGRDYDLAFEADLTGFYKLGRSLDARLIFAALIPFGALDYDLYGWEASPALTFQANVTWMF